MCLYFFIFEKVCHFTEVKIDREKIYDDFLRRKLYWKNLSIYEMTNNIWTALWQNQQNGMCPQQTLRWAWASAQSDQS